MTAIWAGIGAGKTPHHRVVIDESGKRLLSRRVADDGRGLPKLLGEVLDQGEAAPWGVDSADGGAGLVSRSCSTERPTVPPA